MTRVAGVDPGTVSFDLCVLDDGEPVLERVFDPEPDLAGALLRELSAHGPYALVYGPSGYGIPLTRGEEIGETELAQMVLVRGDERGADAGIGGLRALLRTLAGSAQPFVFGPGVIHLPSVPAHRKRNRIDLGTADKLCAAACAIADAASRCNVASGEVSLIVLELGGAFSGVIAVDGGRVVDGAGGTAGPVGARAAGALDGELAYLLGPALVKDTLFSGGALDPDGTGTDPATLWGSPDHAEDWTALVESGCKAVRSMAVSVPAPAEIIVTGRLARIAPLLARLASGLADLAPVRALVPGRASAAARGAALLADGLCGGVHAPLVDTLRIREATGSSLDHLRVAGARSIALG